MVALKYYNKYKMNLYLLTFLFYFYIQNGECLWKGGVVHYAINKKDYDYHSQDIIITAFEKIQREICVKFFNTPLNYSANEEDKILYISNAEKRKDCPTEEYDFDETVVDMNIGYKCLNENDIARMVVEMLRASIRIHGPRETKKIVGIRSPDGLEIKLWMIKVSVPGRASLVTARMGRLDWGSTTLTQKISANYASTGRANSYDQEERLPSALLSAKDRNFINSNYHDECAQLRVRDIPVSRKFASNIKVSIDNEKYYKNKLWPLGIVIYSGLENVALTRAMAELRYAMTTIEMASCIVFHKLNEGELRPKSFLWFSLEDGEVMPRLGVMEGNQTLYLPAMVDGAPKHTAHALSMLLRILGVPMMSNRYDRDNYVTVNWNNIQKGMEHYLERMPLEAMLRNSDGEVVPYDFTSATHAPSNYLCRDCSRGQQTVTPILDHLWQRTLTMGHRNNLNPSDIETLSLLYAKECRIRISGKDE